MTPELLDRSLLMPGDEITPGRFGATLDAHGLYNTFQFVLRLSPKIHAALQEMPGGIVSSADLTWEQAQAASTYLHETIHWWQHIGSTYGFVFSLGFPCGLQMNLAKLKQLVDLDGFKKSIRSVAFHASGPSTPESATGLANIIINNQFDFAAFGRLTYSAEARIATLKHPMFEGVGYVFNIAWSNAVGLIGSNFDPSWELLTDPRKWGPVFDFLSGPDAGCQFSGGLFKRSDRVPVYPVGSMEIMEGQARFAQLQFLHFGSGGRQDWAEFEAAGMLQGPYVAAFETFLALTNEERPESFNHPIVALFLLICDMALNPGAGFPEPLTFPHALVPDIDPGARFDLLGRVVRQLVPEALAEIQNYSRDEYVRVSNRLADEAKIDAPLKIAEEIASWPARSATVAKVMNEYENYAYDGMNLAVRVLFSHFVAFMRDKALHPEVFCWPGVWLTGDRISGDLATLLDRHGALFIDKPDDDGVFPRLRADRDPRAIQETFDEFYAAIVLYDMAQQWISEDGPFRYDLEWLVQHGTKEQFKTYADRIFEQAFGLQPDQAILMPPISLEA